MTYLTRRSFLSRSALGAVGSIIAKSAKGEPQYRSTDQFQSNWQHSPDRIWLGPEYWANPLQDWCIAGGRIECIHAAPERSIHLLTCEAGEGDGSIVMRVRVGRRGGAPLAGPGSVGFRIGVQGPLGDYRNALIFGSGINAGITGDGGVFIGRVSGARPGALSLKKESVELRLTAQPADKDYVLTFTVVDTTGAVLGSAEERVRADRLKGNLTLVNNFGASTNDGQTPYRSNDAGSSSEGTFWFADWHISGSKLQKHHDRAFGPILFSQYPLSKGVLKLSAQLAPIGPYDSKSIRLQVQRGAKWHDVAVSNVEASSRIALFRIDRWSANEDVRYRIVYGLALRDGAIEDHFWSGVIRRDPVGSPILTVAPVSCNTHEAFPNTEYVRRMGELNPDMLAFTGDQFYQSSGGFGIVREPEATAVIDYLRKWYLHGWTWRELTRDRPSVSLPDDHDVYQGNLWGESGEGIRTTQAGGGYEMPAGWVNVVYRTQTAHHPDPYDGQPGRRGTIQYYGSLTYGGVSFAILADRQYKAGPEGKVPHDSVRADWVTDRDFEPNSAAKP